MKLEKQRKNERNRHEVNSDEWTNIRVTPDFILTLQRDFSDRKSDVK